MSARLYFFGGTEADSTAPMTQHDAHASIDTRRRPVSDDELESGWPTTKRFARSAHGPDAAWRDADYARCVEAPQPSLKTRLVDALWWIASALLLWGVWEWVQYVMRGGL